MPGLPSSPSRAHRRPATLAALAATLISAACGGGGGSAVAPPAAAHASEAEWRALAQPRPPALEGAPTVALAEVLITGTPTWSPPAGVGAELGLTELAAAGLLRRQDVRYVERRRFAAAAEAERRGLPRPAGAPAAGISPGARFVAHATWSLLVPDSGRVDVRLLDPASGAVVAGWRGATPPGADPLTVARTVVAGVLAALDAAGGRPAWADPAGGAAGPGSPAAQIPAQAVTDFFLGLVEEDAWRWEEARVRYQRALAAGGSGFLEAAAALARTARLRNGGTLGEG